MTRIIEKELSYKIMGVLFNIHNKLSGEYQEKYYQRAIAKAFKKEKIKYEEQIEVDLEFDKEKIGKYYLDFLIEGKVILEIKAIPRLRPIHFRQVRAYLKAKNLELGILANFRGSKLTYKRILYPSSIRINHSDNSNSDTFGLNDPYIELAQYAIKGYLKQSCLPETPSNLPKKLLTDRAGTFVSLHNKSNGNLRGCIGTFLPTKKNIAQEIIANAIAAATQDPRFPPVTKKELPDLEISVDILSKPKTIGKDTPGVGEYHPLEWRDRLDPKKYGLIVSTKDGRRGLLLPDIPGVETAEQQIQICRQKGGIGQEEPVKLKIFTVIRHMI